MYASIRFRMHELFPLSDANHAWLHLSVTQPQRHIRFNRHSCRSRQIVLITELGRFVHSSHHFIARSSMSGSVSHSRPALCIRTKSIRSSSGTVERQTSERRVVPTQKRQTD